MMHSSTSRLLLSCLALASVGCGDDALTFDPSSTCVTACHPRNGDLAWKSLPTDGAPSPRRFHVAVWTGSEMLVWGGMQDKVSDLAGDGAAYDPKTDSWRPIASEGAPSPRHSAQAVWTGKHMLVWGGFDANGYPMGGGAYNPTTDKWAEIPDAPIQGRTKHSSVWTGSELVVWGGLAAKGALSDGARFSMASGQWTALPSDAPKARGAHVAVWSGSEMIVWGGMDTFDWFADGRKLTIGSNAWGEATTSDGAPTLREAATGLWTGKEMLVWGGWNGGDYQNTGALYSPGADAWKAMTDGDVTGRAGHVGVWTGDELFVWGGCTGDSCSTILGDGGRYTAASGWTPVLTNAVSTARIGATGVWTGTEVVIFGGSNEFFKPVAGGMRTPL